MQRAQKHRCVLWSDRAQLVACQCLLRSLTPGTRYHGAAKLRIISILTFSKQTMEMDSKQIVYNALLQSLCLPAGITAATATTGQQETVCWLPAKDTRLDPV